MNKTKLRYVVAESAPQLETLIESLGFMVEIKSVTPFGGKWYCWFTVTPANETMQRLMPQLDETKTGTTKKGKSKKQ